MRRKGRRKGCEGRKGERRGEKDDKKRKEVWVLKGEDGVHR